MKKQTSINIFGVEQRLVFHETPDRPKEGSVCYVSNNKPVMDKGKSKVERAAKWLDEQNIKTQLDEATSAADKAEKRAAELKEDQPQSAEAARKTAKAVRETVKAAREAFEEAHQNNVVKAKVAFTKARDSANVAIQHSQQAGLETSSDAARAATILVKLVNRWVVSAQDVADDISTEQLDKFVGGPSAETLVAIEERELERDTEENLDRVGELALPTSFGETEALSAQVVAPQKDEVKILAAEVAATGATGIVEKPETAKETVLTDKGRVDITLGYINGVRKGQHLDITRAGFKDYFGVSLKSKEPSEVVTAIKKKQEELNAKGARLGKLDGILGPKTYAAIKQYDDAGFKKLTQGMIVAKQKETAFQTLENLQNQILQGRNNIRQYDNDARVSATTAGESLATLQKSTLNTPGNTLEHADKSIKYADATEGYFQKAQAEIVKIENAIKTIPNASLTDGMRAMQHESQQLRNDIVEAAYSARMSAKQATEFAAERSREVYKQALDQRKTTPNLVTPEVVQGALTNYRLWQSKSNQQKQKLTAAEKEKNDLQKTA